MMNDDELFCLTAAFRYASGRHTYAMDVTCGQIARRLIDMDEGQLDKIMYEIKSRRRYAAAGMSWDTIADEEQRVEWLEYRVIEQRKRLKGEGENAGEK